MAEKVKTEFEQIADEWQGFKTTLAYQKLIEYINMQKDFYNIIASGPMEVYNEVVTNDGYKSTQFEFEPEKYAYLLQRGVGCDIVKLYIEGYSNPSV